MNPPKSQHWLPQLYLRAFCTQEPPTDNPRLWVFFRHGPNEPRRMRPEEVAAQNYLYSPARADGTRDYSLEHKLAELESVLGSLWPSLTTGMVPLDEPSVRKILALFVSTLYLRNPQRMREHQMIHDRVRAILEGQDGHPHAPQSANATKSRPRDAFQETFTDHILDARRLAEVILGKRWVILCADSPVFATCDSPVVVEGAGGAPVAFGTTGTSIQVPLSPTRFLVINDDEGPSGYYSYKPGFAEAVNHQMWTAADRYLLSWQPSDLMLKGIMSFAEAHRLA